MSEDLEYKKHGLTVEDVKRIARTKDVNTTLKLRKQGGLQVFLAFIQEFQIGSGEKLVTTTELYQPFEAWCKWRRVEEIPHMRTGFGRYMTGQFSKAKRNGKRFYKLNKSAAEVEALREKKEKQTESKIDQEN